MLCTLWTACQAMLIITKNHSWIRLYYKMVQFIGILPKGFLVPIYNNISNLPVLIFVVYTLIDHYSSWWNNCTGNLTVIVFISVHTYPTHLTNAWMEEHIQFQPLLKNKNKQHYDNINHNLKLGEGNFQTFIMLKWQKCISFY